ncbi:ABC transporter substrate-binding protein [Thioalkalicoccus limnaeus]|uniref:ABC transporter substrate-binding protein n=1 Tax=Thioalkalicoccus limnaeus TaxID=120681 RepID=A0ABV4BBC6_9GAMM
MTSPTSRRSIPLLILLALIWLPGPAATQPLTAPQQVVEKVSDELMRVLREDRQLIERDPEYVYRLVDERFLPHVDFERVSALVLGPVWREASPAQREAFGEEFKHMLIRSYAAAVNELSEWEIQYLPMSLDPDARNAIVRTRILRRGGQPTAVDYRMVRRGERWLAYDVSIEGVSLLANYRSSFVRLARERGIDGLIADLADRNLERQGS